MIKPAALVMAVVMGAVSAGTYYGLNLLPPGLLPEPIGRAQKPEPPKPGTSTFAPGATDTAAAEAPVEPKPVTEQPVTEEDLAEDPAPAETAPPAQAQAQPATAPEPEPEAAPAPAPKPQKQAAAPAAEPAAPEERPPVTIVDGRKEATAEEAPTATASAEPARPTKPAPPEADVIKPWWPDASKMPANQLKLQYAGQVQGEQAIALLFSAPLNLETVKEHAQIKTASGQAVKGSWQLGKNPRLAVFRGLDSGRYTVILTPQITDAQGFMLGQTLKGPVYIQAPQQP